MFFTRLGRVVAWLVLIFSFLRLALAVYLATTYQLDAARRYLGPQNAGEVIDQSMIAILFAVVLGILTEISRSVAKRDA